MKKYKAETIWEGEIPGEDTSPPFEVYMADDVGAVLKSIIAEARAQECSGLKSAAFLDACDMIEALFLAQLEGTP